MRKIRLLCIPPYEGMRDLMANIAARRSDVELLIHVGDLESGVKIVAENIGTGIDAIVSRGGTAEIIRREFSIPTCDITLSVYDVLRAIRLAQNFTETFALVGFKSITQPAVMLCDLLQYNITSKTIPSASEAEEVLSDLKAQGLSLIVGDMVAVTSAKKLNMNGVLITSGFESIEAAIDDAVQLYRNYSEVKLSLCLLDDILSSSGNDMVVYDTLGIRCYSTLPELPPSLQTVLERGVPSVIAGEPLKAICNIAGMPISIEGRYLSSSEKEYCVYCICKRNFSQDSGNSVLRYIGPDEDLDCDPFEYFVGSSGATQNMIDSLNRYSALDLPVLILGEPGTGKDRFAHYLYTHSRLKHNTFVLIDCYIMSDKHWKTLLESENSPLCDTGLTIYIKRLGSATAEQRLKLKTYLKLTSVSKRNRMLFSYTYESGFSEKDELYLYLIESLSCLTLKCPPLRQRKGDIPLLVGLYINAQNVSLNTQVVGIVTEGMLMLQNFPWERNIAQLYRVIRELVVNTKTSYISAASVESVLNREKNPQTVSPDIGINLNRTLDEITHEIVLRVFEEEKTNQTKTAKRLGISRSTLWRMLQ